MYKIFSKFFLKLTNQRVFYRLFRFPASLLRNDKIILKEIFHFLDNVAMFVKEQSHHLSLI